MKSPDLGGNDIAGNRLHRLRERYTDPLLTTLTIMLAVLLFVIGPLQASGVVTAHAFGGAFVLVLIAAVFIVSGSGLALMAVVAAGTLLVVSSILRMQQPSLLDVYLDATSWLITGVTLSIVVARAVFAPGHVSFHRVVGAILLYLTIGLVFAALFCFLVLLDGSALSGLGVLQDDFSIAGNLTYFSFTTLTTMGYGDIVPVHPLARSLANIEAILGQLYPATLLARLVTLELEHRRDR
jgi:hypothetical protein